MSIARKVRRTQSRDKKLEAFKTEDGRIGFKFHTDNAHQLLRIIEKNTREHLAERWQEIRQVGLAAHHTMALLAPQAGTYCVHEAVLTAAALKARGYQARPIVGEAVIRFGPGEADTVAFIAADSQLLPPESQVIYSGIGSFRGHAWCEVELDGIPTLIDGSLSGLRENIARSDAQIGLASTLDWAPGTLVTHAGFAYQMPGQIVAGGRHGGSYAYRRHPDLEALVLASETAALAASELHGIEMLLSGGTLITPMGQVTLPELATGARA